MNQTEVNKILYQYIFLNPDIFEKLRGPMLVDGAKDKQITKAFEKVNVMFEKKAFR